MRRFTIILISVLLISSSNIATSNAIFGLGKCSKVKKEIRKEESVGKVYWKEADQIRKRILTKPRNSVMASDFNDFMIPIIKTLKSDLKAHKIIQKNQNCFSATLIAKSRDSEQVLSNYIKGFEDNWVVRYGNWAKTTTISDAAYRSIKEYYTEFYSVLDSEK
jgi:hypothetical protein